MLEDMADLMVTITTIEATIITTIHRMDIVITMIARTIILITMAIITIHTGMVVDGIMAYSCGLTSDRHPSSDLVAYAPIES
jgi:hypothetical protein